MNYQLLPIRFVLSVSVSQEVHLHQLSRLHFTFNFRAANYFSFCVSKLFTFYVVPIRTTYKLLKIDVHNLKTLMGVFVLL